MNIFPIKRRVSCIASATAASLMITALGAIPATATEINTVAVSEMSATEAVQHVSHILDIADIDGEAPVSTLAIDDVDSLIGEDDLTGEAEVDLSEIYGDNFSLELADSNDQKSVSGDFAVIESDNNGLKHLVQQLPEGATRLLTLADDTYTDNSIHEYEYDTSLPDGQWLHLFEDGTVGILADANAFPAEYLSPEESADLLSSMLPDGTYLDEESLASLEETTDLPDGTVLVGLFAQPWAIDANGAALPTTFSVKDNHLIQQVDTSEAVFPVVADPLPLVPIALVSLARILAPHVVRAFVAQTIRVGAKATISGGYRTFQAFKNAYGVKKGYQWHHIVEQATIKKRGFDARWIHNKNNLVQIPTAVHQKCINSWMSKKGIRKFGAATGKNQTLRQWIHSQKFEKQHSVGVALLKYCGVSL
ncbi:MAG: hypothetical protein MSS97_07085 [Arcanobacterium sp.]|nr:hypothetical protein [Arcanobacterium sp.]